MLTADTGLQAGLHGAALLDAHPHQLADAVVEQVPFTIDAEPTADVATSASSLLLSLDLDPPVSGSDARAYQLQVRPLVQRLKKRQIEPPQFRREIDATAQDRIRRVSHDHLDNPKDLWLQYRACAANSKRQVPPNPAN